MKKSDLSKLSWNLLGAAVLGLAVMGGCGPTGTDPATDAGSAAADGGDDPDVCTPACGEHGTCVDGACDCDTGHEGAACDTCGAGYHDDDGDGLCELPGPDSEAGDIAALEDLAAATGVASWNDSTGWATSGMTLDPPPFGVTVEEINGERRVTEIDLEDNGLSGTLNDSLANLREITKFRVKRNDLGGDLPTTLGTWTKCRYLSLAGRKVEDIETIRLTSWNKKHGVASNQFTGPLPASYYDMPLEIFELDGQYGQFDGTLAPEAGQWNIRRIFISGNLWHDETRGSAWSGDIPSEIKRWVECEAFILTDNDFTGIGLDAFEGWNDIPRRIGFALTINVLDDTDRHWNQPFPDMSHMTEMIRMNASGRVWTGEFPAYLLTFSGVRNFTISQSSFDAVGDLPSMEDNTAMYSLSMSYLNGRSDDVSGRLFPDGQNVAGFFNNRMILWDVRHSGFSGQLPAGWETWHQLRYYRAQENNLTGPLPPEPPAKHGPTFRGLFLQGNSLTGPIPATYGQIGSQELYGGVIGGGTITDFGTDDRGHWIEDSSKSFAVDEWATPESHPGPLLNHPASRSNRIRRIESNTATRIYYAEVHGTDYNRIAVGDTYEFVRNGETDVRSLDNVDLARNELSGVIPAEAAPVSMGSGGTFNVANNRFVFADIVPNLAAIEAQASSGGWSFRYAPQKDFGEARVRSASAGSSVTLSDFAGVVTHGDNVYQWQRDGTDLTNGGAISGATSNTLTVSDISSAEAGTYTLVVTNPGAPDLTLTSEALEVTVP